MEKPLVSVILPIYNVEKYLDKCVESVVNQTYRNLEIILVDDGAKDNSPGICEKWAKQDNRIIVIHKKNAGLGMARNTGLDVAHGRYVAFVDSDDFVEENAVEKLIDGLGDADTVFCGHNIYYNAHQIDPQPIRYAGSVFKGKAIQEKILVEMMGAEPSDPTDIMLPVSVWHGLYSMDIIRQYHIRFPSEREFISEDMIFDIDYFAHSQKVVFIDACLYYYRKNNEGSLTTIYNAERFNKEVVLYKEICRKMSNLLPEKAYLLRVQRTFLGRVRSCIMRAEKQSTNPSDNIKVMCKDQTVKSVIRTYPYHQNKPSLRFFNFCIENELVTLLRVMARMR